MACFLLTMPAGQAILTLNEIDRKRRRYKMVQVDLITGFLGAGKTTFLRRYAAYLAGQGERVCILENDFGAVNVDAMLVQDLLELGCQRYR